MTKISLHLFLLMLSLPPAYALQEGQSAPACKPISQMSQQQADGKVLLIDFWATWCAPCLKSMPFFNSLYNELNQKGFEIVAVNVDEDSEIARQFLKNRPVSYPVSFDPQGECPKTFEVKAMPSSYLIDKRGIMRKIHLGYRDGDQATLREAIETLLKE